jgi:hypothetical protein
MDDAAGRAFLSLNLRDAIALVEKMTSNQSWNEERTQPRKKGGGIQLTQGGRHAVYQDGPADEEARGLSW